MDQDHNGRMFDDLSVELRRALDKRRELEQKVQELNNELQQNRERVSPECVRITLHLVEYAQLQPLADRVHELERDLWLTCERWIEGVQSNSYITLH